MKATDNMPPFVLLPLPTFMSYSASLKVGFISKGVIIFYHFHVVLSVVHPKRLVFFSPHQVAFEKDFTGKISRLPETNLCAFKIF